MHTPATSTVTDLSLETLLSRAQAGDADAFCRVCDLHDAALLRQAIQLCGGGTDAEELTQDTLVAAWKGIGGFHGRCRFSTWLCAILLNLHRSRCRERSRRERHLLPAPAGEDDDPIHDIPDAAANPLEHLDARERTTALRDCLARLPEKQRDVVFLRFYADESLENIAAALGCSLGTVKSRLFHALEKLRSMRQLGAVSTPPGSLP